MKRNVQSFSVKEFNTLKEQLLYWANQFGSCSFLDNNNYSAPQSGVECRVGVGAIATFSPSHDHQRLLMQFLAETNDWLFGHVSYEYKNVLPRAGTSKEVVDEIGFDLIHFFQPEIVVLLYRDTIEIQTVNTDPAIIFDEINSFPIHSSLQNEESVSPIPTISKEEYLNSVRQIQKYIARGDCYEINFCQKFLAKEVAINTVGVYQRLTKLSPNPYACYYKINNQYLLCASPERYLNKTGSQLISQPIKGTFKRDLSNVDADERLGKALFESPKERAENVMIVDLVRNDLSKICQEGSVHVSELFGIYTYPNVHQMISTIVGTIDEDIDFTQILEATFPMGSMTGAPKKRVMELIDEYEPSARGLYSGSVGYITPEKDFDFNVVIRSVLYNETNKSLSYQVGSGITHYCNPEDEYEECILKARSIREVLGEKGNQ